MTNRPAPQNIMRWFDPRYRSISTWGFILNRVTALGLTLYLFLHLVMLGKLAQGAEAYDSFVELAHTPIIQVGELLVIAGGLIHGLNGIRIALNSFGIGVTHQRAIFIGLMALAVAGTALFAAKMFLGA
jgi:succinate dehydrogenase / fumarate reductase, cytochrome b subunit